MAVTTSAVRDALGKTGSFNFREATQNGFTRTHAGSGYKRINPSQAHNGNAPSSHTAPYRSDDWEGYSHASLNAGSGLQATVGYGEIDLTFTKPGGYDLDTANQTQRASWKDAGTTLDETATAVNPFSSPDGTKDLGDGASGNIDSALTGGHYYAVGVKLEWDDSVTVHKNADSAAYAPDAGWANPLTGAGRGILVGPVYATAPTINSVVQTTDPSTCIAGCTGCVDVQINVDMEGPSKGTLQESVDMGAWATVDSNVTAGSSALTRTGLDSGKNYRYRLAYNDVSPTTYSNVLGVDTECTVP